MKTLSNIRAACHELYLLLYVPRVKKEIGARKKTQERKDGRDRKRVTRKITVRNKKWHSHYDDQMTPRTVTGPGAKHVLVYSVIYVMWFIIIKHRSLSSCQINKSLVWHVKKRGYKISLPPPSPPTFTCFTHTKHEQATDRRHAAEIPPTNSRGRGEWAGASRLSEGFTSCKISSSYGYILRAAKMHQNGPHRLFLLVVFYLPLEETYITTAVVVAMAKTTQHAGNQSKP